MSVKMTGSAHDAAALRASNLFKNAHKLPKVRMNLENMLTCSLCCVSNYQFGWKLICCAGK